jgi:hypothetical protein
MRRVVILAAAVLALAGGDVSAPAAPAPSLPLPCGLPQVQPLWVDYADGMVPFWASIFARPGIVGAASGRIVPPQLRSNGAQTVYFDLYLSNRVGTPTKPADPGVIQARADKLFDAAVASTGCGQPLIAENELFGAQSPTPWTASTAQYRANVLAYLQRLAERGARAILLLSTRPYTHDEVADQWWNQVAQVADLVPEVYFSGPAIARLGPVLGSRRLRTTLRSRLDDLVEIGIPPSGLGVMLTFSSTPGAGGREGLALPQWLDVVKWEAFAAARVGGEVGIGSIWSWGWATWSEAGADPDKMKAACTWLWARNQALCDAPSLAGGALDTSLDVGAALPDGATCVLGATTIPTADVTALTLLTGEADIAFSAAFQHAVLADAAAADPRAVTRAERDTIIDHFRGSRAAYLAALARAHATPALARTVLGDELRRRQLAVSLRVSPPTSAQLQDWYVTYASAETRPVRASAPEPWLGGARAGLAVQGQAPGRLFVMPTGRTATIDGVPVTAAGPTAPLGSVPYAQALPAVRNGLANQARAAAFATWVRRRENQALGRLACQKDELPQPAAVDLTDWLPYLAIP